MSIDWERAEIAPDKVQKIEGRILLDLRAKINELERDLIKNKDDLRKTKESLKEVQTKLSGREKSLVKITEKFSAAKKNLDIVQEGMWMVVNGTKGTARGSSLETVEFAGKTGTAQVVKLQQGDQEDLPVKFRDHGWFICFAPADEPIIAMAILVEHGMGGSRSAAPIAKHIFERLFNPQEFLVKY